MDSGNYDDGSRSFRRAESEKRTALQFSQNLTTIFTIFYAIPYDFPLYSP